MGSGLTWVIGVASVARAERPYSRACLKFEFMTQRLTRVGSRDAGGSENLQPTSHICWSFNNVEDHTRLFKIV